MSGTAVHLAIDAVGARHSGAVTVLEGVLEAVVRHPGVERATVFCSPDWAVNTSRGSQKIAIVCRVGEEQIWRRVFWPAAGLPRHSRRVGAHVVLSLSGTGRAPRSVPLAVFIQQALVLGSHIGDEPWRSRFRLKLLKAQMGRACREASLVVTQTPEVAEAVSRTFGTDPEKLKWWLPSPRWEPRKHSRPYRDPSDREFIILYIGSDRPYKNLSVLFEAVSMVRASVRARVVIAGARSKVAELPEFVSHLGYLGGLQLQQAYESADVLVMPSLVETIGFPLVEAMSVGLPVIAADRPYARRVCESAAMFFDPERPQELAAALRSLYGDGEKASALSKAGLLRASQLQIARPYDGLVDAVVSLASHGN